MMKELEIEINDRNGYSQSIKHLRKLQNLRGHISPQNLHPPEILHRKINFQS
jgi:hypothetical protein